MAYDSARAHAAGKAAYRKALREARAVAIQLAAKLMKDAVEGRTVDSEGNSMVPREAVQAMAEVLKEAREAFGESSGKGKLNKPGIRSGMTIEQAEKELE